MSAGHTMREWWTKALLQESHSAHPVLGNDLYVKVDGQVVTLEGTVESADQAEEIEAEARAAAPQHEIVNRLTVVGNDETQHNQAVLALFGNADEARVAAQTVSAWKWHGDRVPEVHKGVREARRRLRELAESARVPSDSLEDLVDAIRNGKALLIDRVPEDEAVRIISSLEGTRAQCIRTLPPEPDSLG